MKYSSTSTYGHWVKVLSLTSTLLGSISVKIILCNSHLTTSWHGVISRRRDNSQTVDDGRLIICCSTKGVLEIHSNSPQTGIQWTSNLVCKVHSEQTKIFPHVKTVEKKCVCLSTE